MAGFGSSSREQFEQRMRARRAATCLSAARSAVAGGRLAEAIERLEEACSLDPSAAEARLLLDELRVQDAPLGAVAEADAAPPPPRQSEVASWSHWVAAVLAIGVLAALAFMWPQARPLRGAGAAPERPARPALAPRDAPAAAEIVHSGNDVARSPSSIGTSGGERDVLTGLGSAAAPSAMGELARTEPAPPANAPAVTESLPIVPAPAAATADNRPAPPAADASAGHPPPAPAAEAAQPLAPEQRIAPLQQQQPAAVNTVPALAPTPVMAEDLTRRVPSEAISSASLSAPAAPAAGGQDAAEASLSPAADPANEVGETLQRYADAYSRLDAAAAHAVWPTVNERALARAFDGLASQGLVFDQCEVRVQGAEATAACSGRTRYVPKVGSRDPVVERRLWSFRLRRADAGWRIVQAEVR